MPNDPATIPDLLNAGRDDAPAIGAPGRAPLTYAGLRRLIADTAVALNGAGIGRADRVAIVLANGPEAATAFLAASAAAATAPLNPSYSEDEFAFYLDDLGARALIIEAGSESAAVAVARRRGIIVVGLVSEADGPAGSFALECDAAPSPAPVRPPVPEDTALVLHTSGTTSRPKMVPLSHANVAASARNIARSLALTDADHCLNVMPLFHIHGLVAALSASLSAGGQVTCCPGFNALCVFAWLQEADPTWYTAVPTMHQAILARASHNAEVIEKLRLRLVRSSSAALPPTVMAALEEAFGAPAIEAYGMTEAAHQMASNPLPPAPRKPGTVGVAAGPEVAVMDEAGQRLAAGETGEVVIRGTNVFGGYEANPKANAEAFTDGWFRTGDQGVIDEGGYLTITGRLKEIINRGGEKVAPREVDDTLLGHEAVAQAVTFAVPHPTLGEEVAAAIVLRDGATATDAEIRGYASERLAAFKVPRRIVFVDEIPKGPTGKLRRIGLAETLGLT